MWNATSWLIGAMLALATVASWAQAPQDPLAPTIKVNRSLAGDLDATGWTVAQSVEGYFAVRMPMKFNDLTVLSNDPKSPITKLFSLVAQTAEGIKFTVSRIMYRKAASGQQAFKDVASGKGLSQPAKAISALTYMGYNAIDLTAESGPVTLYQRVLLVGGDIVTLTAESPTQFLEKVDPLVPVFYQSLNVGKR